jgi:glutamate synthase (NADPH/NADH) small chain
MGKPTGFVEIARRSPLRRPVQERIRDWKHVYALLPADAVQEQGARCMDCGIPFCQQGCPLGNLIPEWNDLVFHDRWKAAFHRLAATNNFPELTGHLCPAPCEGSCVLGLAGEAVGIKDIELAVVERAFAAGWIAARSQTARTGRRVAIVGSGPAGLATADELNRAGHLVTVFERADRIGGLLRYGIPEFKLEKHVLDRRLALLEEEGIAFRTGVNVGTDISASELRRTFDAIVLCGGAGQPRDLQIPGRESTGIHFAVEYLAQQNRLCAGDAIPADQVISAEGRRVIVIGGGDTGADCVGTAHRQRALSIHQLEIMARPPATRAGGNPWPEWPHVFRISPAHEEGGERWYSVATERFVADADGRVCRLEGVHAERTPADRPDGNPRSPQAFTLEADLVLLAAGFTGPEPASLLTELDLRLTDRGHLWRGADWMTSEPGVFAAGDIQRGASLIVWAIADGRRAAGAVDAWLMTQRP